MSYPTNLKYAKTHEWVLFTDSKTAKIGLSEFAQNALGSIVFVNLPQEGDAITSGGSIGEVESVKAVSDVICPVTGVVTAVNSELLDAPEKINEDAYGSWLVEISEISAQAELLDAAAYEAFCQEEA